MANATPINVSAADLMMAGTQVAGHLDTAAIAPVHALPVPVAVTPVDAATRGAVTAMHTKMAAMSQGLMAKSGELQTTTDASAAAMQAQDANNASPLKDLASAIPSSGGGGASSGGNGGRFDSGSHHSGQGKIDAVDHAFKTDGGDKGPHDCSGREQADGGLGILSGVGKTVGGIATTIVGAGVGVAGAAAEGPSAGTSTAIVAGGVALAGTGISVIAEGVKGIIDGFDDLSNCK